MPPGRACHLPELRRARIRRLPDGTWVERAGGQVLLPWDCTGVREAESALHHEAAVILQAPIPARVRVLAKGFPGNHAALLRLLSAVPETEPLARKHPALFLLLARRFDRQRASLIPRQAVLTLLRRPRKAIWAWLTERPPCQAEVNFLAKLPAAEAWADALIPLAAACRQPWFGKGLRHLPRISRDVARIAGDPRLWPLLTPALLREIAERPGCWPGPWPEEAPEGVLRRAAERLGRTAGGLPERDWPRFRSAADLRQFLARLGPRRAELAPACAPPAAETPLPPWPGGHHADLEPLTTVGAMRAEGRQRENCIGEEGMISRACAGTAHAFVLHRPERVTLLVGRRGGPEAPWIIEDIRGFANATPRFSTVRRAVEVLGIPAQPPWLPEAIVDCWVCPLTPMEAAAPKDQPGKSGR